MVAIWFPKLLEQIELRSFDLVSFPGEISLVSIFRSGVLSHENGLCGSMLKVKLSD